MNPSSSDDASSVPDLSGLESLASSFVPAWAKETAPSERLSRLAEKHGTSDRGPRPEKRRDDRGPRQSQDRRPAPGRGAGGDRPNRRPERRDSRRPEPTPRPAPAPLFSGWNLQFIADRHGVEGMTKQIKTSAKAYSLFDLAWLVLEKPERYLVEFRRAAETPSPLIQVREDRSLWISESEAIAHVLATQFDKFYRRERVAIDAPKGTYPFVAACGISGVLLGPTSYHDYQSKLHKLHAERFSNMPFDAYKSRIRILRDEESIQKWKEEQSWKDEFYPLTTPEGTEPAKLGTLAEVEQHFRQNHAATSLMAIRERVAAPGPLALNGSSPAILQFVRRALDELRRFPLPLAHTLGRQFTSKGLHIFQAHEKITYVGVARPRYLDRDTTPVSDSLRGILEYLEAHASTPRVEQWKDLVAQHILGEGQTEADREPAVAKDLLWLLHEGHVIDYARRGLEAARRPKPPATPKKPKKKPVPAEPTPPVDPPAAI